MDLQHALMIVGDVRMIDRMEQEAKERVQTALVAVLMAQESPALLSGLSEALKEAQSELPALEERERQAVEQKAKDRQKLDELEAELRRRPANLAERREREIEQALKDARRLFRHVETDTSIAQSKLKEKRSDCRELEQKIAAIQAISAPDPDVLAAIRGK